MKKTYKSIILLLIFLLSIGAVCATDTVCDDVLGDCNQDTLVSSQNDILNDNNQETQELTQNDISSEDIQDTLVSSQNDILNDENLENLETTDNVLNDNPEDDLQAIEDLNSNNDQDEPISNTIHEDVSISSENEMSSNTISSTQEESLKSDGESYGFVVFGSNVISLNIYNVKGGEISKQTFNEASPTASYTVNNNLSQDGIEKLVTILEGFNNILDSKGIDSRYVFATASMRKIQNPDEVISIVNDRLGITIEVISGEEEAEIGFNAVKNTDLIVDDGLLIDLGGGSCEVTNFEDKTIVTSESMPIGSNSLFKTFVSVLLPNETEAENIKNNVTGELAKLSIDESASFEHLFGTGGTIYTIKLMLIYLNMIDSDTLCVPATMLDDLYDILKVNSKETYQKIISVDSSRINTLVPGLICTQTILKHFNVQYLHFCKSTLEDGILSKVIERENNKEIPNLTASNINTTSDEDIVITVKLANDAQGKVTVELNNATYNAVVKDGTVSITTPKLKGGNYIAKISYSGDEKYLSLKENISIHVKTAKINASNMNRGLNSNYDYQVKLVDENGNAIKNKMITFTIGQKQYYAKTNNNGVASIKIGLAAGTYNVTISSPLVNKQITKTLKIIKRIQNNKNVNTNYNSIKRLRLKSLETMEKRKPKERL